MSRTPRGAAISSFSAGGASSSEESYNGHLATPQYDASAIEHMKLSLDDDCPYPSGRGDDDEDDEDEEDEEEEQERFSRGRSRSRSLHGLDEDPNTGVIRVDPNNIPPLQINEPKLQEVVEKTGPLPQKEIETLKKGVEEALPHKNSDAVREEQEEQQDAEDERKSRASCANSAASTSSESRRVKILMLGDSGVGKSSLIIRWTQDTFSTDLVGTVGVNFKTRKINAGGECVQVQVWDTAGQEQFHKITTSYYKGANGIMLVYDVSDKKSVENVEYWVRNIKSHASENVHVALIGNKVDLRAASSTPRGAGAPYMCEANFGASFAARFGVPYFETSAKESTNVDQAFQTLVTAIVESDKQNSPRASSSTSSASSAATTLSNSSTASLSAGNLKDKKDKKDCVIS